MTRRTAAVSELTGVCAWRTVVNRAYPVRLASITGLPGGRGMRHLGGVWLFACPWFRNGVPAFPNRAASRPGPAGRKLQAGAVLDPECEVHRVDPGGPALAGLEDRVVLA